MSAYEIKVKNGVLVEMTALDIPWLAFSLLLFSLLCPIIHTKLISIPFPGVLLIFLK